MAIIFPLELFIYFWSIIFRLEICLKENMCGESGGDEIWKYVCLDVTFWGDSLRQGDRIIAEPDIIRLLGLSSSGLM